MLPIKIGKYSLTIPQNQEEISRDAYMRICTLILQQDSDAIRAKVIWHLILTEMSRKQQRIFKNGYIDPYAILKLSEHISWLWDRFEIEGGTEIKPWVPEFRWKRATYMAPQPNFNDVTLDEFAHISMYLDEIAAGDAEAVYGLASAVCRPIRNKKQLHSPDFDGYPRQAFNPNVIDPELFKSAPEWILWNVYDMCLRAQLMIGKKYQPLFDGKKSDGPNFGWLGIIMNIAESGTYGNASHVKQENIHTICIYAVKKVLEQRKHEEELEQIKEKNARR